jgi:hypothetical protein
VQAGVSGSLEASLGLEAGVTAVAGVGTGANLAAGFNLAAAGGVGAAIESVKIASAQTAQAQARQSFLAPSAPAAPAGTATASGTRALPVNVGAGRAQAGLPEQGRTPLKREGLPRRAPLRLAHRCRRAPTRVPPPSLSACRCGPPWLHRRSALGVRARRGRASPAHPSGAPPVSDDPTTPALGGIASATCRARAGHRAQIARTRGCRGPCSHRGGR